MDWAKQILPCEVSCRLTSSLTEGGEPTLPYPPSVLYYVLYKVNKF